MKKCLMDYNKNIKNGLDYLRNKILKTYKTKNTKKKRNENSP